MKTNLVIRNNMVRTPVYVMKEIINRYQRLGSSAYLCFLDASKAFERINHDTLFKKLVNRNVPAYIVRLLVFWYSHQQMFVKWGNVMSSVFTVSNGVRQGGVYSHPICLTCTWMALVKC